MTLRGVDCASFQGVPRDWQGAAGDIGWAAVKVTEVQPDGSVYHDPDAPADMAWLANRDKGRLPYLFAHPAAPVAATVGAFTASLRGMGLRDSDGAGVDLEVTDGLSPAAVNLWAHRVLSALESELGRIPVCYTYLDFALAGNCASLGRWPLWMSDPSSPEGRPRVPAPWHDWTIDQYATSEPIDRDVARFGSLEDMRKALGKPQPVRGHEHIVHWHLVGVRRSMNWECRRHHTTADDMFAAAEAAGHRYGPAMRAYKERGNWDDLIPEFTDLFAYSR